MELIARALVVPLLLMVALAIGARAAAQMEDAADAATAAATDASALDLEMIATDGGYAPPGPAKPFGNAWAGAANGNVTLVVWTDYGRPSCREAQTVIDRLLAEDPEVKIVFRLMLLSSRSDNPTMDYDEIDRARPEMEVINDAFPGRRAVHASLKVAEARSHAEWYAFHRALMARGATSAKIVGAVAEQMRVPYYAEPVHVSVDENTKFSDAEMEWARNSSTMSNSADVSAPAWSIGNDRIRHGFDYSAIRAGINEARKAASK